MRNHLEERAVARARSAFLDDEGEFGCAEATYLALADVFGLASDPSVAMALNGGVAYAGGTCGALTGAALAVGLLAGARIPEHRVAKRIARELMMAATVRFEAACGATTCRALSGFDFRAPGGHDAFIADGRWRTACTAQITFMVRALAGMADPGEWDVRVAALG